MLLRIARGDSTTSSAAQWHFSFQPRQDQRIRDTRAYWQGCVADDIMFMQGQARWPFLAPRLMAAAAVRITETVVA